MRLDSKICLALCVLAVLALGILAQIHLDEPFAQDYDEGVYLTSARMALHGYPLFTSVFSSQPPAFLEILAVSFYFFGDEVVTGRGVMIFFYVLSLAATGAIAWRVACPWAGPAAILFLGGVPIYFRQGSIVEAEVPAVSCALVASALLFWPTTTPGPARLVAAGFIFMVGVLCKLFVIPMVFPLVLLLLPAKRVPQAGRSATADATRFFARYVGRAALFGAGCLATGIVLCWPCDVSTMVDQTITFHLEAKKHYPADWTQNLETIAALLQLHQVLPLLALSGLLFLYANQSYYALWLHLWILATGAFLVEHAPLFPRHVVLLLPPLAVAAAGNLLLVPVLWPRRLGKVIVLALLLAFAWFVAHWVKTDLRLVMERAPAADSDRRVIQLIKERTQPADLVVSDQQMQVFRAGRRVPPELCDTSLVRIESGYLTNEDAIRASQGARMIIFRTGRLAQLARYAVWVAANYRFVGNLDQSSVFYKENPLKGSAP